MRTFACVAMIFGLLGLVLYQGGRTFWPREILRIERKDGGVLLGRVGRGRRRGGHAES